MAKADSSKEAETPALQDATRNLEEKIFDAKDAALRLWERNRHLQERVARLESRSKFLTRCALGALGLVLASLGLLAFIAKEQIAPLQSQVTTLQATLSPVQAQLEELERVRQTGASSATAATEEARMQQLKQDLLESVKKLAPEILATAMKDGGQVSLPTAASGAVTTTTVGTVKGPTGETLRIAVGRTDPQKTPWVQYNEGGIYVDIDTSSAGFAATPYYFTSLSGHTNNWMAQGVTSIYLPTAKGFRVHVGHQDLTTAQAKNWGWSISWIAIGN
jgi:Tfp pilus assembly protein PilN